jgi:hypothetical protein
VQIRVDTNTRLRVRRYATSEALKPPVFSDGENAISDVMSTRKTGVPLDQAIPGLFSGRSASQMRLFMSSILRRKNWKYQGIMSSVSGIMTSPERPGMMPGR